MFKTPWIDQSFISSTGQVCTEIVIRLGTVLVPLKKILSVTFNEEGVNLRVESCDMFVFVDYGQIQNKGDYYLPVPKGKNYRLETVIWIKYPDGNQSIQRWHPLLVFNLLVQFFNDVGIPVKIDMEAPYFFPKGTRFVPGRSHMERVSF